MFCRKCGKSIPEDSVFCSYCGEKIKAKEEQGSKEKEYGFCADCGAPLPDGKLVGICDNCLNSENAKSASYGRCEECGNLLEKDDGALCKSCSNKIINPPTHKSWYTSGPVEPIKVTKEKHGCLYTFLGVLAVFIIAVTIASIAPPPNDNPDPSDMRSSAASVSNAPSMIASSAPTKKPDLELLEDSGGNQGAAGVHITGMVKNNTGKTYSYVQIQYALYDKDNNQIGTALANTNGLDSGRTWKFDAIGIADNVDTYKLINLTGY